MSEHLVSWNVTKQTCELDKDMSLGYDRDGTSSVLVVSLSRIVLLGQILVVLIEYERVRREGVSWEGALWPPSLCQRLCFCLITTTLFCGC